MTTQLHAHDSAGWNSLPATARVCPRSPISRAFVGLVVLAMFLAGWPHSRANPPRDERLKLSAKIDPESEGKRLGEISLANTAPSVLVLWSDTCSWGHEAFRLSATDADGKTSSFPRKQIAWRKNVPKTRSLKSGEAWVFKLNFSNEWEGFDFANPRWKTVRVVYKVEPDEQALKHGVWTGEIDSGPITIR